MLTPHALLNKRYVFLEAMLVAARYPGPIDQHRAVVDGLFSRDRWDLRVITPDHLGERIGVFRTPP
jgi:hypothetical protein